MAGIGQSKARGAGTGGASPPMSATASTMPSEMEFAGAVAMGSRTAAAMRLKMGFALAGAAADATVSATQGAMVGARPASPGPGVSGSPAGSTRPSVALTEGSSGLAPLRPTPSRRTALGDRRLSRASSGPMSSIGARSRPAPAEGAGGA